MLQRLSLSLYLNPRLRMEELAHWNITSDVVALRQRGLHRRVRRPVRGFAVAIASSLEIIVRRVEEILRHDRLLQAPLRLFLFVFFQICARFSKFVYCYSKNVVIDNWHFHFQPMHCFNEYSIASYSCYQY